MTITTQQEEIIERTSQYTQKTEAFKEQQKQNYCESTLSKQSANNNELQYQQKQNPENNKNVSNKQQKLNIFQIILEQLIIIYRYLQSKVENPKVKAEFMERKCLPTPKYRGQVHNYGKWVSIIPSLYLIYTAETYTSRKMAIIYGIGVFWLMFISSKMHCRPFQTAPTWVRKVDNVSIFLYIGMNWYTLINQLMDKHPYWYIAKGVMYSIMTFAVIIRCLTLHSPRWLISILALSMGWISILALPTLVYEICFFEQFCFLMGGLSITVGTLCWMKQWPKQKSPLGWTPHENFHLGVVFMMGFFYLVLYSLQTTNPGE